jgi:hypothetical protein
MSNTFKFGDTVKLNEESKVFTFSNTGNKFKGLIGQIESVDETDGTYWVEFENDTGSWFYAHELRLVHKQDTIKYETKLVKMEGVSSTEYIENLLDSYGDEGWELKAIDYGGFILQRIKR